MQVSTYDTRSFLVAACSFLLNIQLDFNETTVYGLGSRSGIQKPKPKTSDFEFRCRFVSAAVDSTLASRCGLRCGFS